MKTGQMAKLGLVNVGGKSFYFNAGYAKNGEPFFTITGKRKGQDLERIVLFTNQIQAVYPALHEALERFLTEFPRPGAKPEKAPITNSIDTSSKLEAPELSEEPQPVENMPEEPPEHLELGLDSQADELWGEGQWDFCNDCGHYYSLEFDACPNEECAEMMGMKAGIHSRNPRKALGDVAI